MEAAAHRKEVVIGGCCVYGDERDPTFECQSCGDRFGAMQWNLERGDGDEHA
jgi:hypothetical protein